MFMFLEMHVVLVPTLYLLLAEFILFLLFQVFVRT
jgi:hypothetical protein